jgi:hypothetical protein
VRDGSAGGDTERGPMDRRSDQPPYGEAIDARPWGDASSLSCGRCFRLLVTRSRATALYVGVTGPSVARVSAEGAGPTAGEREVAFSSRCLEWPWAVSGVLVPAATFNQPSRLSGLRGGARRATRCEAAPRDRRSAWRGGDQSPRRTNSNYARRLTLSRTCQANVKTL